MWFPFSTGLVMSFTFLRLLAGQDKNAKSILLSDKGRIHFFSQGYFWESEHNRLVQNLNSAPRLQFPCLCHLHYPHTPRIVKMIIYLSSYNSIKWILFFEAMDVREWIPNNSSGYTQWTLFTYLIMCIILNLDVFSVE